MNHTLSGNISRKISSNRYIRRSLLISAVTLASVLLASPAMADRYRTVTVYETHRQPLVVIYGAPSTSVHIVRDSHHTHRDTFFDTVYRSTSYRSSYDSHERGHNSHDRHKSSSHRSYNSNVRHYGSGQARGSWSSGRQRDVIYVDKRGKKTSTYRQVERNSVQIRDRRR